MACGYSWMHRCRTLGEDGKLVLCGPKQMGIFVDHGDVQNVPPYCSMIPGRLIESGEMS